MRFFLCLALSVIPSRILCVNFVNAYMTLKIDIVVATMSAWMFQQSANCMFQLVNTNLCLAVDQISYYDYFYVHHKSSMGSPLSNKCAMLLKKWLLKQGRSFSAVKYPNLKVFEIPFFTLHFNITVLFAFSSSNLDRTLVRVQKRLTTNNNCQFLQFRIWAWLFALYE